MTLSAMASEPLKNLIVWAKDGTKVGYALAEKPTVTFTENHLIITTQGIEVSYALEQMERFTYEGNETTAITNLVTDKSSFVLDGESLLFPALEANSLISLYLMNGAPVFKIKNPNKGEYAFPLSDLSPGIYLVNVNGITYKIMKK